MRSRYLTIYTISKIIYNLILSEYHQYSLNVESSLDKLGNLDLFNLSYFRFAYSNMWLR